MGRSTFASTVLFLALLALAVPAASAPQSPEHHYISQECRIAYTNDVMPDGSPCYRVLAWQSSELGGFLADFRLAPGDRILRVGNYQVMPGDQLDSLMALARIEQNRTVLLVDVSTGWRLTRAF